MKEMIQIEYLKAQTVGKDYSSNPQEVLAYLMSVRSKKSASLMTIYGLLSQFLEDMSLQHRFLNLHFEPFQFSQQCCALYEEYIENRLIFKAKPFDRVNVYQPHDRIQRKATHKSKGYLVNSKLNSKEIACVLENTDGLVENMKQYFDVLTTQWVQNVKSTRSVSSRYNTKYEPHLRLDEPGPYKGLLTSFDYTSQKLIQRAIDVARYRIASNFFSMLIKYHENCEPFDSLEATLFNGWKFLETYFSSWKDVDISPMVNKFNSGLQKVGYMSGKAVDWSNKHEVVRLFIDKKVSKYLPHTFAMYLCHLWKDELVSEDYGRNISEMNDSLVKNVPSTF